MSVLVFAESVEGRFHKPAFEALTYGYDTAQKLGTSLVAVVIGQTQAGELDKLGRYGAQEIFTIDDARLKSFSVQAYASIMQQVLATSGADLIVISSTFSGKSLAARLAAKMKAGIVTGVLDLPKTDNGFVVRKSVYSGKGFADFVMNSAIKVLTININSYHVAEHPVSTSVRAFTATLSDTDFPFTVLETHRESGTISLPEAELVVSGGRGMKGPENWAPLEELARILGAATACSKPVADVGWRPHHEHVGQTGLTISPNLYIAIGISGAIQHLAGVSSSKVIAVINKDPEAPFFKAADYGIVGDAFEILPKLIEAAKKLKSAS